MKLMLQIVLGIFILILAVSIYTLWANKVPWSDTPGSWQRLQVYLGQNVAETSEHASFPELQPRTYAMKSTHLLDALTQHVVALGWELRSVDADKLEITATVKSRWLQFTDDITLKLEPLPNNKTRLHIRSASRIGHADFGANIGHIIRLNWSLEHL